MIGDSIAVSVAVFFIFDRGYLEVSVDCCFVGSVPRYIC